MDISKWMLGVAADREVDGDLIYSDMGQGMPFRPGTFDAAISISAIQWLCTAETKEEDPIKRIRLFFETLYKVLVRGGRCVFSRPLIRYRHFSSTHITQSRLSC